MTDLSSLLTNVGHMVEQYTKERVTEATSPLINEVARLQILVDKLQPPPAVRKTFIGACPTPTGGVTGVLARYGAKASIRAFIPGDFAIAVIRPETASHIHYSWKPTSTITDAKVATACKNLLDNDTVEVIHEADVKYRKGASLPAMLAYKNAFHAAVVRLRNAGHIAKVKTCNTLSGWSVDSTAGINPSNFHCNADLLGIDMDGLPAKYDFYPYAARQMSEKFIQMYKGGIYSGWIIPEFCMPSVEGDTNGSRRIAWFKSEVAKLSLGVPDQGVPPPIAINWFDFPGIIGPEEMLNLESERAAWRALVGV